MEEFEGPEIWDYLRDVWKQMKATVYTGLNTEGVLHGGLGVQRKAKFLVRQRHIDESAETRENRKVCAYAFAVSEENAGGGMVVTAPTCGASGVLPAVLLFKQEQHGFSDTDVYHALATAGGHRQCDQDKRLHLRRRVRLPGGDRQRLLHGGGRPGGALSHGAGPDRVRRRGGHGAPPGPDLRPHRRPGADPCIERNAVAAMRAINALSLANFLTYTRKISFDVVVKTMYETGRDLFSKYRETSEGGLAKLYTP